MNNLTNNSKKIIKERLYDKGIIININDLDNYMIDTDNFKSLNEAFSFIVENWGLTIIETPKTFKYTYRTRGFSMGCQPKNGFLTWYKDKNYKFELIEYDRELTQNEIDNFELIKI